MVNFARPNPDPDLVAQLLDGLDDVNLKALS